MITSAPHPRDRHLLIGHEDATRTLSSAARSDRLHHAWLIGGGEGTGKATLAYRFARHLLAPDSERLPGGDGLGVDPNGRTARQMSAGAHPNLVVLERQVGDGEKSVPKTITVEAVRKALGFFGTTAANGGRRICIIDSAEILTIASANALLKTIEEPPPNALVMIVSHVPQRVLPTIRSRCRKLSLQPLGLEQVRAVLDTLADDIGPADAALLDRAATLSEGSVGRALSLLDPRRIALIDDLTRLLEALPSVSMKTVLAVGDKLGDRRGLDDFPIALDTILTWMTAKIEADRDRGPTRLAPLVEACDAVTEAARSVEVYNLDRRAFIVSTFGDLAEAVRRAA